MTTNNFKLFCFIPGVVLLLAPILPLPYSFYIFLFCISYVGFCQEESLSCDTYAWIDFDNDLFFKTDRYYTNGVVLGFIHPVIKMSPFHVLLYTRGENMMYYSGLSITQEMYTPTDTDTKEFHAHDRPYTGTLFATPINKPFKKRFTFCLNVLSFCIYYLLTANFSINKISKNPTIAKTIARDNSGSPSKEKGVTLC